MESRTEPGVFSGHSAVAWLVGVDVQYEMVDPIAKHPFATRLDFVRGIGEVETTGKGFRIGSPFPVGMSNGAGGAAFNIAQSSFRPELAPHLIGIAAINGEVTRKTPMPIRLAPENQVMFVRRIAKSADIVFGNHIGHGAT